MGLKLFNPVYDSPPDAIIERSQFWGVSVGWWQQCVISTGPVLKTREVPYGGNVCTIGINPDFWAASSSAWPISEMIDTLYVIGPGGGAPGYAGNVSLSFSFQPYFGIYIFNVAFLPNDGTYIVFKLPGDLNSGWAPEVQPDLPPLFRSQSFNPSHVYTAAIC